MKKIGRDCPMTVRVEHTQTFTFNGWKNSRRLTLVGENIPAGDEGYNRKENPCWCTANQWMVSAGGEIVGYRWEEHPAPGEWAERYRKNWQPFIRNAEARRAADLLIKAFRSGQLKSIL